MIIEEDLSLDIPALEKQKLRTISLIWIDLMLDDAEKYAKEFFNIEKPDLLAVAALMNGWIKIQHAQYGLAWKIAHGTRRQVNRAYEAEDRLIQIKRVYYSGFM